MRDGRAIARALGGRRIKGGWSFCCPCHEDRKPSAAIRERDGLITCFAHCDRRALAAALDQLGFVDDGIAPIPISAEDQQALDAQAIRRAKQLWDDSDV